MKKKADREMKQLASLQPCKAQAASPRGANMVTIMHMGNIIIIFTQALKLITSRKKEQPISY